MRNVLIGTADLPERMDRERYFRELSYLELSALFTGPLKPSALAKWSAAAPKGSLGLVAPWVLTQRTAPPSTRPWPHDATVGEMVDSAPARGAFVELRSAVAAVGAACAIFRSSANHSPSAANRDQLRWFFSELATAEALGCLRVWQPGGLWNSRSAVKLATELGVACAFDPLVRDPGDPPEIHYDLEAPALYFRVEGLGRSGAIRSEKLEDLAALLQHYEDLPVTVAFASPARWADARNLKKLLADETVDDEGDDSEVT